MGYYLTHRISTMCSVWLNEQWNIPDKKDHYMMSLMCTVARIMSNHPNTIQPDKFRLVFNVGKKKLTPEEEQKHLENVKMMRMASLGGRNRMTKVDANGNVIEKAKELPKRILSRGNNANSDGTRGASNQIRSGHSSTPTGVEGERISTEELRKRRRRV